MSDLIERLRTERSVYDAELCDEAADALEAMQARVAELEELLGNCRDASEAIGERNEELEELCQELNDWFEAYPEQIFTPLKGDPIKKTSDYDTEEKRNLITRASAAMARHMIERIPEKIKQALKGDNDE